VEELVAEVLDTKTIYLSHPEIHIPSSLGLAELEVLALMAEPATLFLQQQLAEMAQ
jgi:hypothetical protein